MAQAEEELTRPPDLGILRDVDDRVLASALRASRDLDLEQNESVVSIARALEGINEAESRAGLEHRIGMLEDQLEQLKLRRDEVDQAIESRISVLRTTIESALEAVGSPLQIPDPDLETRIAPVGAQEEKVAPDDRHSDFDTIRLAFEEVDPAPEPARAPEQAAARAPLAPGSLHWPPAVSDTGSQPDPDQDALTRLRDEFEAKLQQARSDLRYEILKSTDDQAPAPGNQALDALRQEFEQRIGESEEKAYRAAVYLEKLIRGVQRDLERQPQGQAAPTEQIHPGPVGAQSSRQ